jgi:carboxylate-amine ligase
MAFEAKVGHPPEVYAPLVVSGSVSAVGAETGFSFGLEEEYFVANIETMEVAKETPSAMFDELSERTAGRGGKESLQAQIEVSTSPSTDTAAARDELAFLRATAALVAEKHGFAILASGTHPSAEWKGIAHTHSERYEGIMDALQMIGRRNMLCGMHVHVELPDPAQRVAVMARTIPYLPLFMALATSSPFWQSRNTGLKCYRMAAYDELPRSGLPELFDTTEEYERYVAALVRAGMIADASHIWWTIRPSSKYPTLELRAPDCCTRFEDAIGLACLYRVLVRYLFRNPARDAVSAVTRAIAVENKWQAQRFGVHASFATEGAPIAVADMLEALIEMTAEDADALGCAREIAHCRTMIADGTSADKQLSIYESCKSEGEDAAVRAAARWVAETTKAV